MTTFRVLARQMTHGLPSVSCVVDAWMASFSWIDWLARSLVIDCVRSAEHLALSQIISYRSVLVLYSRYHSNAATPNNTAATPRNTRVTTLNWLISTLRRVRSSSSVSVVSTYDLPESGGRINKTPCEFKNTSPKISVTINNASDAELIRYR